MTLIQFYDADPATATVGVIESVRGFEAFQRWILASKYFIS